MMPQKSVNRLPDNQHIQLEVQKTSEGDLHTEAGELTATPKYTKKADPAGQEVSEEPEENIKPKSRCDTLSIFIAGDEHTI